MYKGCDYMIKEFVKRFEEFKSIEKNILKVMYKGFRVCFGIAIFSSLILLFYILNPISYIIYESGIILFKTSITFLVFVFITGIVTNNVKKEIG